MKVITFFITFFMATSLFAKTDRAILDQLANQYYNTQIQAEVLAFLNKGSLAEQDPCEPDQRSCVDAACKYLDSFRCDDRREIEELARACRGNYNGGCLDAACHYLDSFRCDDTREVKELIHACENVYGGGCIHSICERLSPHSCDDTREMMEVIESCKRNK